MKTIVLPNGYEFIPFDNPLGVGYWMAVAEFPDESMLNERMQHDWRLGSCLLDAVRKGRLRVRDYQTRFPLKPDAPSVAVLLSLVSVEDFREFVADLGYEVQVRTDAATPTPLEIYAGNPTTLTGVHESDGSSLKPAAPYGRVKGVRWTEKELEDLSIHRSRHVEEETARHFGVSGTMVRRLLKRQKDARRYAQLGNRYLATGLCCTNRIADGMTPTPDGPMPWQSPARFKDSRSG